MVATRRIRVSGASAAGDVPAKAARRMDELLTSLCGIEHELKSIALRQQDEAAELQALMQKYHKTSQHNASGEARIEVWPGRKTVTIDPAKFAKAVSSEDFYACAKIGMTEAKKVLSEKEIERISTVTPPVPGDPKLKIIPA